MKMKIPEIRKKYLFKEQWKSLAYMNDLEVELLSIYTAGDECWCHCRGVKWSGIAHTIKLKQFWDYFEELTNQPKKEPPFTNLKKDADLERKSKINQHKE